MNKDKIYFLLHPPQNDHVTVVVNEQPIKNTKQQKKKCGTDDPDVTNLERKSVLSCSCGNDNTRVKRSG